MDNKIDSKVECRPIDMNTNWVIIKRIILGEQTKKLIPFFKQMYLFFSVVSKEFKTGHCTD